ncbi:MAG: excinuclease ABC subunit UvrA [Paludibacteraceae bacterium]|nr:excinuclease ABC subunit UvrA [Paludibacteraceae bacterium]
MTAESQHQTDTHQTDSYCIHIKGARVNNLKNVEVRIPRNRMTVITGLSGSGKSSLAFDTLYAEGQRRYVESLSAYARQFLGRMKKPEVDFIRGIPPAIAIEQKVTTRNPRSTVGTSTEIYDYLKLLFARVGRTYSPVSGQQVQKHQPQDVVDYIMAQPHGLRMMLLAPVVLTNGRTLRQQLEAWQSQGFSRVLADGDVKPLADLIDVADRLKPDELQLVVDRVVSDGEQQTANRLADSVQTALFEGNGACSVRLLTDPVSQQDFSIRFEADGIRFELPTTHLFDFNNPIGACPTCQGFGNIIGIDPDLVVPDKSLSIYEGAIACWHGEKMSLWNKELILNADKFGFPIHTPYYQLTDEQRQVIWTGNAFFHGLNDFFKMLEHEQYQKIQYRVMLSRYRGKTLCPDCLGGRLRREATYVRVGDKTITELVGMPIDDLARWFGQLQVDPVDMKTADRLLREIGSRLRYLQDVGLGYLTLNRLSSTLSGGESQRINLAKSVGSALVGSLYILDEPSIGLHPRDTQRLINVLHKLRDLGNTVVVVEHDEEIMRAADYLIDIGPDAGRQGGNVVLEAAVGDLNREDIRAQADRSYTLRYLNGTDRMPLPAFRRTWNNYIDILGATENNLKNIDARIPLGVLCCVTGVSGSGKSTLIRQILYPALKKYYGGTAEHTGSFGQLKGSLSSITDVELVDQNPIGRSTRSNPVTYVKAYDEIRRLFADQQLSKQMGYTAATFSFNTDGGRCEACEGEGTITIPMQFMADIVMTCEHCHGRRFKADVLEVLYRGRSIYDVLQMTVDEAIAFFEQGKTAVEKRIVQRLRPLQDVGIGYVQLGQSSSTLSGGESQRVKLANFLQQESTQPKLFIFDEPTTGLHYHDIRKLLAAINQLIAHGNSAVIIEHNTEVIRQADYIIDLGPEGGNNGGQIVFSGTPEQLVTSCPESHTAKAMQQLTGNT